MIEEHLIYPLYLFYGLVFFAIGVSITSRDTRTSNLTIANVLWPFAAFAFSHALLEWYSLYLILYSSVFSDASVPYFNIGKLLLLTISFCFLLVFGVQVLGKVFPQKSRYLYLIFPVLLSLLLVDAAIGQKADLVTFAEIDLNIRNYVGFPGSTLAGAALILYSRTVNHISRRGAWNFVGAGVSLACYGILSGLMPSSSSMVLLGGPIELYRGIAGLVILHFVMHALHIFYVERDMQIKDRLNRFAQSEKLASLGKLAFGVAHEINNPLGNVSINVELLKNDLLPLSAQQPHAKRFAVIERNLDRVSKIARELLFFSTNKEADFQLTDVNEVLESTLELLGTRRKSYVISTTCLSSAPIPAIPWKLEEVFLNILLNAMEAMPGGGQIEIVTEKKDEWVQVEINDNGPGIDEQDLPYVLDPFFTTKAVGKGTGLGLSICFGIMELHGGMINLNSRENGGTRVILKFPTGAKNHV